MKNALYFLQAIFIYLLYGFFRILPVNLASAIGGKTLQIIGPCLPSHKTALKNLTRAFPEKTDSEKQQITKKMWNNLGRIFAEYPHIKYLAKHKSKITNTDFLKDIPQAIVIGCHQGNWEISCVAYYLQNHATPDLTYRALNNPYIDTLLRKSRTANDALASYPKSSTGGKQVMKALKNGKTVGFLMDQKYNEGAEIDFFGHPAMTNEAAVTLAKKFNLPIIPIQNIRENGANFTLITHNPIKIYDDNKETLKSINTMFEEWIKQHPEQWLWIHNRWKNKT